MRRTSFPLLPVVLSFLGLAGLSSCAGGPAVTGGDAPRWEVDRVAPGTSLRGLCAVSAGLLWASGTGGAVLRSEDGGVSWSHVGPADAGDLDFRDVHAFSADRALVASAGQPARVYATRDGGDSWRIVLEDPRPAAFFDALTFFDEARGLLFGDSIDGATQLFVTEDGGDNWRALPASSAPALAMGEAGFAASGTCLVAFAGDRACLVTGGSRSRALLSCDRGRSWSAVALPLLQGAPSQGAFSVAFRDARNGVVVGGDYRDPGRAAGCAAVTADGGRTWRAVAGAGLGYRSGVVFAGSRCIAVGAEGCSWSVDLGASWQRFGDQGFHAVAVAGERIVAVGADGRVGRLLLPP